MLSQAARLTRRYFALPRVSGLGYGQQRFRSWLPESQCRGFATRRRKARKVVQATATSAQETDPLDAIAEMMGAGRSTAAEIDPAVQMEGARYMSMDFEEPAHRKLSTEERRHLANMAYLKEVPWTSGEFCRRVFNVWVGNTPVDRSEKVFKDMTVAQGKQMMLGVLALFLIWRAIAWYTDQPTEASLIAMAMRARVYDAEKLRRQQEALRISVGEGDIPVQKRSVEQYSILSGVLELATGAVAAVSSHQGSGPFWLSKRAALVSRAGGPPTFQAGDLKPDLPSFTSEQLKAHNGKHKDGHVWVSYRHGVYDVTEFLSQHPGGARKLMMAAGGSVAPFWRMYGQHQQNNRQAHRLIEEYRIGNLEGFEESSAGDSGDQGDPYKDEPERHPSLLVRSRTPFNAESPVDMLAESYLTPNDLFYVRHHLPVPVVDPQEYRLTVSGPGLKTRQFTLEELKTQFPKHSVAATVQCAGNRRNEINAIKPVKGGKWDESAISNAVWTGALLYDVMASCVDEKTVTHPHSRIPAEIEHLHFTGLDQDMAGQPYGAGVTVDYLIDGHDGRHKEVVLAYEMNGEELPRDHGYPIRVVVPGVVGARSVKWLASVEGSVSESPAHWQQNDYKGFNPSVDWGCVNFSSMPSILDYPMQSAITDISVSPIYEGALTAHSGSGPKVSPGNGTSLRFVVDADTLRELGNEPEDEDECVLTLKGYAWAGGGRPVIRVDLSVDGGDTWFNADLDPVGTFTNSAGGGRTEADALRAKGRKQQADQRGRAYGWTLWEAGVTRQQLCNALAGAQKTDEDNAEIVVVCKAVDRSYNTQPDSAAGIWNLRGVLANHWHRKQVGFQVKKGE